MEDKQISRKVLIIELIITLILTVLIFIIGRYTIFIDIPDIYLSYFKSYLLYWLYASFLIGYSLSFLFLNLVTNFFEKKYLKKYETKLENIEFDYYRDIIKNYSVATICSCYGKNIKIKDQLVATLLSLKLNDYIEINDEVTIKNEFAKHKSEIMLIKALKGVRIYSKDEIENQIDEDNRDDCMKSDLFIKDKISSTAHLKNSMFNFDLVLWIINFVSILFIRYLPLMIIAFVFHFILLIILIRGGSNSRTIFVRNQKGIELQKKLCGLKRYLEDFGNMSEKDLKEIELYEDYMLYAIIFDLKGKLNKEANKLYEKHIKNLIYK